MMIILISALILAITLIIVLLVIASNLKSKIAQYKTATCLSVGKLGRLYRMPEAASLKQNLWHIWRATEVFVPKDDLDAISNCFYREQ